MEEELNMSLDEIIQKRNEKIARNAAQTRRMQTLVQRPQSSQVLKARNFQVLKKTPVFTHRNSYQLYLAKKKLANAIRDVNLRRRQNLRRCQRNSDSDLVVTISNDFRRKRFTRGSAALSRENLARFNAALGNKQSSRTVTPEGSVITTISQSVRGSRRQPSVTGSYRSFRGGTFVYRGISRQSRPRSRNDFNNCGSYPGSMYRFLSNESQHSRSRSRQRSLSRGRAPLLSRQAEIEDAEIIELTEQDIKNLQALRSGPFSTLCLGEDQNGRQIVTFEMKVAYSQKELEQKLKENKEKFKRKLGEVVESELKCGICNEIFYDPVTLNCQHTFCSYCATKWKKTESICALCRGPNIYHKRAIVIESFVKKIVDFLPEDMKQHRQKFITERKAEAMLLAQDAAPPAPVASIRTGQQNGGRRGGPTINIGEGRQRNENVELITISDSESAESDSDE